MTHPIAIIQARMGSQRFPGKSLATLDGKPIIQHVIERALALRVDKICVAIPDTPADSSLAAWLRYVRDPRFTWIQITNRDPNDVLGRFAAVAELFPDADPIVRLTGDCCFLDPEHSQSLIDAYLGVPRYAYVHNSGLGSRWPEGIDTEVISRSALFDANREALTAYDREHVTPFIRNRPARFRSRLVNKDDADWSQWHFSIDTVDDAERARQIVHLLPAGSTDVRTLVLTARDIHRFWSLVDQSGPDCWPWVGLRFSDGYGRVRFQGRSARAHRVAYQLTRGFVPDEQLVCHHCDNPICCRSDHLFAGSPKDNWDDAIAKGRIAVQGEDNGNAKITAQQATDIRYRFANGESKWILASHFGLHEEVIMRIVRGDQWRTAPGPLFVATGVSSRPEYICIREK